MKQRLNLYGPDVIVLGGGLANSLGAWLQYIRLGLGLFACPFDGYQVNECQPVDPR